jgi:hypothetical protein
MHESDSTRQSHEQGTRDAAKSKQRIHRVCVTCNNMFETDADHIDAKYCPACRRAA